LVSGDGRHVAINGEGDRLLFLRDTRSDFARDNLMELSGIDSEPIPLTQWNGAECTSDFCSITLTRDGRVWQVLMARSGELVPERQLAAACDLADIVIADRYLPRSCRPRWIKADRRMLDQSGGLAISLTDSSYRTVADGQGDHGWWRGGR
jgi:competence protein ComEC